MYRAYEFFFFAAELSPAIYPQFVVGQGGYDVVGEVESLNSPVDACVDAVETSSHALGPLEAVVRKALAEPRAVLRIPRFSVAGRENEQAETDDECDSSASVTTDGHGHFVFGRYTSDSTPVSDKRKPARGSLSSSFIPVNVRRLSVQRRHGM